MSLLKFADQRIEKNRRDEARNGDLRKMLVQHNILAGHGRSEKHVEELRRKRLEASERKDMFMDYTYVKGAQDQERRLLVADAEDRMADELARRSAAQERQEQDRRRICDGSEELRVLKQRLHGAKVNKERAQQLLEIEIRKEKQRRLDHKVAEHIENERLASIELDHKIELDKMRQRERVKQINQHQICTKEAQREEAMQEYVKEKQQVQDLVDKIQAEDDAEQVAKEQHRRESREMLRRFMIEQAERQEAMEQAEIDENNKIENFARAKAEREEQVARDKAEAEKEKERIQLGIIERTAAKNKAAEELEYLRNELNHEEHEHKAREIEKKKAQKRLDDRDDMKKAYAMQMAEAKKKQAWEKAEEDKLRDQLLEKFAEDDRIEQMNQQKRRLRVEVHKREAKRLVDQHREMFEKARNDERAEEHRKRAEEANRQVVIEEERKKLLKEHGLPLRDFLPKGTLQTSDDFDLIFRANMLPPLNPYVGKSGKRAGNLTAR